MHITTVIKKADLSPKIRKFDEAMMRWYHHRGMHTTLSAEDLIKRFPTFLVSIGSFTLSIQSGGKKYPKGFSLTVFNPDNIVVDDRNYMFEKKGRKVPKKWPHGAYVVDGRRPMKFVPPNRNHPHFSPSR